MSAMLDALKQKRAGGMNGPSQSSPMNDQGGDKLQDLKALVDSLSPDQKEELQGLLAESAEGSEMGDGSNEMQIPNGAPSSDERSKVQAKMDGGSLSEDDSDDIAASMTDRRYANENTQPRNLGERMKMSLASKLKGKGKL